MPRSAAIPSRADGPGLRLVQRPERLAIAVARPPRRRAQRTPPFAALEWAVLTVLGALVLAFATG